MKSIAVRENGTSALEVANRYFSTVNLGMSVSPMNQDDVDWCIALARESDFDIDWRLAKMSLYADSEFGFIFKIDADIPTTKPDGACVCSFNTINHILSIELLQNFSKRGSILDGKMLTYCLVIILFFLIKVEGEGVYIQSPVNEKVADYYIKSHQFLDVSGDKSILFRSADDLLNWFISYSNRR
ncbi:hypothetical protein [Pectobacterium carotovorum]|uniref:hypothetical protein n=1 Tax=Pectobacterium carotovorum TaxID=554 RepID=UPI00058050F6|nr:hypothetical protein [Pectobacterium carotovorum]KHT32897.1 hypothetical protein RD01_11960 [Pectobacterium carotovorum subsp. carotovorum]KHT37844.1 hypothetical protein RC99_01985 [Pectobacterium carotovorum subsp. carotovorum]MBA0178839.1 hypothetical protein [Pectobacterium carotovorum]MBA0194158.1 hypothetical protein [Pectobacterium carotovorum]MBA0200802.1 hypothetical protein [Pectobacterium carotovorum]